MIAAFCTVASTALPAPASSPSGRKCLLSALAAVLLLAGCRGSDAPAPTATAPVTPPSAAPSDPPPTSASSTALANSTSSSVPGAAVPFVEQWRGRVGVPVGGEPPKPFVVRDQQGYDSFVATIPTRRIQMKQPAPPSTDPLLKKPPIDFERMLLLVALRSNMYVGPELAGARLEGGKLVVDVTMPPEGDSVHAAAQAGVGTYHAVLVKRVAEKIEFR